MGREMLSQEKNDLGRGQGYRLLVLAQGWDRETIALANWVIGSGDGAARERGEALPEVVCTGAMTSPNFGLLKVRVGLALNLRQKMEARVARDLKHLEWEKESLSKRLTEKLRRELGVHDPKLRA